MWAGWWWLMPAGATSRSDASRSNKPASRYTLSLAGHRDTTPSSAVCVAGDDGGDGSGGAVAVAVAVAGMVVVTGDAACAIMENDVVCVTAIF